MLDKYTCNDCNKQIINPTFCMVINGTTITLCEKCVSKRITLAFVKPQFAKKS